MCPSNKIVSFACVSPECGSRGSDIPSSPVAPYTVELSYLCEAPIIPSKYAVSSFTCEPCATPQEALSPYTLGTDISLSVFTVFAFPIALSSITIAIVIFPTMATALCASMFDLCPIKTIVSFACAIFDTRSGWSLATFPSIPITSVIVDEFSRFLSMWVPWATPSDKFYMLASFFVDSVHIVFDRYALGLANTTISLSGAPVSYLRSPIIGADILRIFPARPCGLPRTWLPIDGGSTSE